MKQYREAALRRIAIGACAAMVAAVGCNAQKAAWDAGLPGVNTKMTVEDVTPRGDVLQARLQGNGFGIETFAPAGEPCASVLRDGQEITFLPNVPLGRLRLGELDCDANGMGSLRVWRDRRGRPQTLTSDPVPRKQANYRVVYRDRDVVFLRGFFPLAHLIGWPGGQDSIAVVQNSEICQAPIDRGVASMEFRPRGPRPLSLVSTNGLCEIIGLVRPPSQTGGDEADGEAASSDS